jgi:CheY-like chemotaxis protein
MTAHRPTVLIVEENRDTRCLLRDALEARDFLTIEAGDGRQGLELCARHPGPIDLLLTEHVLPRLSGLRLAHEARKLRPLRVLILAEDARDPALRSSGYPVLETPFRLQDVAPAAKRILSAPQGAARVLPSAVEAPAPAAPA